MPLRSETVNGCTVLVVAESNILNIEVQHIKGSSRLPKCKCGSWIKHWEKFSGKTRDKCSVVGCTEDAMKGAHIEFVDGNISRWYIMPVCESHNPPTNEEVTVKSNTVFVPVRKDLTCEKSK